MPTSDRNGLREETHFASLASDGAGVTTPTFDCPFSSQTQARAQGRSVQPENVFTVQISPLVTTTIPNDTPRSTDSRDPTAIVSIHKEFPFCMDSKVPAFCPDAVNQTAARPLGDMHSQISGEESQKTSLEPASDQGRGQQAAGLNKYLSRTASWSGSASLPRGYKRSEGSSRLSSVITARPFGTKQSRVSSLPRLHNVSLLCCGRVFLQTYLVLQHMNLFNTCAPSESIVKTIFNPALLEFIFASFQSTLPTLKH